MSAQATPHRCPVCSGHGTVSRPPHIAGDIPTWSASSVEAYPVPRLRGLRHHLEPFRQPVLGACG
jgi:hypothetical protein